MLKLIERCITDRNFAFLLKAETPVFGSRQNRGEGIAGSRGCRNCAGGSCITDGLLSSVLTDAGGKIRAICPPAKKQNEKKNKRINGL